MAQEPKRVPCSKCGVPIRAKGKGAHEARYTGDPERTNALEGRRERTRDTGLKRAGHAGAEVRGRRHRDLFGVDLTSMKWEELVALMLEVRSELDVRYQGVTGGPTGWIPVSPRPASRTRHDALSGWSGEQSSAMMLSAVLLDAVGSFGR
ncbi:MAG: hypothetical protein AMXMBFR13_26150 [Phycisphaerae bacterium]